MLPDGRVETKTGAALTLDKAEEAEGILLQIRQLMAEDPSFDSHAKVL